MGTISIGKWRLDGIISRETRYLDNPSPRVTINHVSINVEI